MTGKRNGVVHGVNYGATGSGTCFIKFLYYSVGLLFSLVVRGEVPNLSFVFSQH